MGYSRKHRAPQTRLGYSEGAKLLAFVPSSGGGLQWFAVVCGGSPAFHCFHYLSSQILVVVCGDLWWFAVVCLIVIPFCMVSMAGEVKLCTEISIFSARRYF